jgi:hypothetical protein
MFTDRAAQSSGNSYVPPVTWSPSCLPGPRTRHPPRRDTALGLDDDVSRNPVLVISPDPLAAALLGAAIELAGHAPRFPQADESPRGALLRVRPRLVFIDCDHEDACSETFVGPALMTGSQVMLFRSRRTRRDVDELAQRLGLRTLEMPQQHDSLTTVLHELMP